MQTTCIFLAFLFISSTLALELRSKTKSLIQADLTNKINTLSNTKLGSMLVSLVELHTLTNGPIEELQTAIEELLADLHLKLDNENAAWAETTTLHNGRVEQFNIQIDGANSDISSSTQKLNDVLYPYQTQLTNDIANYKSRIAENEDTTTQETNARKSRHEDFLSREGDHTSALEAVDEAISFVNQLVNSPSFVQINKAKTALNKVTKKIGHKVAFAPIIKALTQLVLQQNFADQVTVNKIIDLLNQLKNNLNNALAELRANEATDASNWTARQAQLAEELSQLQGQLATAKANLLETNNKIENEKAFVETRTGDLHTYQEQLKQENEIYVVLTGAHDDLVATLNREEETVNQAIDLLLKIDVRDYLKARVNV